MKTNPCALMLAILLTACGESTPPPPPQTKLFAPQREALDKSKQVEETVRQQAEQQKQQTEEQTQ